MRAEVGGPSLLLAQGPVLPSSFPRRQARAGGVRAMRPLQSAPFHRRAFSGVSCCSMPQSTQGSGCAVSGAPGVGAREQREQGGQAQTLPPTARDKPHPRAGFLRESSEIVERFLPLPPPQILPLRNLYFSKGPCRLSVFFS